MGIQRIAPADLEREQQRLRDRLRHHRAPRPLNTRAVVELGEAVLFTWRGKPYRAFVGWKDGTRLADLWMRLTELTDTVSRERMPEYRETLAELVRLFKRVARPTVPRWRLFRRARIALGLYRNPFHDATEAEIGDLAVFFSTLRTKRHGRSG